jgi:hypothetical protein
MISTKLASQGGKFSCFKKAIASPAWTLPLAILAPVIFMGSNNWFMYSFQEIFVSFLVVLMACMLVFMVGKFAYPWFEMFEKKAGFSVRCWFAGFSFSLRISGVFKKPLWHFIFCALFAGVLLVFLELSFRVFFAPEYFRRKIIVICFITAVLLYFITIKSGFKSIRLFLVIWLFLSAGSGLYSFTSAALRERVIFDESEHIVLKERPNIYLFLLESYHDLKSMREIYGIDTEPLQSFVSSHGFIIYENAYSCRASTLASMIDIFSMGSGRAQTIEEDSDIDPFGRNLIGGGSGNQVYRILKENNYYTTYLAVGGWPEWPFYYFSKKGKYLDETDIDLKFRLNSSLRPLYELFPSLDRLMKIRKTSVELIPLGGGKKRRFIEKGSTDNIQLKYRNSLIDNIRVVMEESKSKMPFFLGFKAGALHTPYEWHQKDTWVSSGKYQEAVRKGNQEIFEIVDLIVEKDPSAVIVLIADHGPSRLARIWSGAVSGDIASLDALLKQRGESLDTLASDLYGVFLAIRIPGKGDISNGLPMSNVNVFRHIFAALADNADPDVGRAILQRRVPSESNLHGITLVKDGVVQRPEDP